MNATPKSLATPVYTISPARNKALVLLHGDGHVVAYGQKSLDVCIVNVIQVHDIKNELLAEECLELTLHPWARQIYAPEFVRARGNFELLTPTEILRRQRELELHRRLDQLTAQQEDRVFIC